MDVKTVSAEPDVVIRLKWDEAIILQKFLWDKSNPSTDQMVHGLAATLGVRISNSSSEIASLGG